MFYLTHLFGRDSYIFGQIFRYVLYILYFLNVKRITICLYGSQLCSGFDVIVECK